MRHPIFSISLIVAAMIALSATAAPPAGAAPASDPDKSRKVRLSELPAGLRRLLAKNDVAERTVQVVRKSKYTMVSDGDAWVVYETNNLETRASARSAAPSAVRPTAITFQFGICAGKFGAIRKVNGYVEWSSWDSCAATNPNSIYEHRLRSTLRESGGPFDWFMLDVQTAVAGGSAYSPALTAFGANKCETSESNSFDQVVRVRFHSVDFGPKVSNTTTLPCDA